jgi:hypothetical protein
MNFRDVELLSAYLDGHLSPVEVSRLEVRLSSDTQLMAILQELRETRGVLRRLPRRRAPRNFTLTAKMAGVKPPEPRAYPTLRLATMLTGLLFVASVVLNGLAPIASRSLAAAPAAPLYGMGGGGGGGSGEPPPAATEAPLQAPAPAPFAAAAPTMTAESPALSQKAAPTAPVAQDLAGSSEAAQPTAGANLAPPFAAQPSTVTRNILTIPAAWVILLGLLMLALAAATWLSRRNNERHIRDQWNKR